VCWNSVSEKVKTLLPLSCLHVTLLGNPEFQYPMPLPRSFSRIAEVLLPIVIATCPAQLAWAQAQLGVVPAVSSTLAEAFALYQGGKFASAAEKYRLVLATDDKNCDAYAGLVKTLLKQKDIEQARVIIDKALQNTDSPKIRVALGEVEYREGSVSSAEREWVNVVNSDHPQAGAYLGIAKLSTAFSLHKRARTMIERAYATDPNDADVRKAWMSTLSWSQRVKFMEAYLAQNNADDQETQTNLRQYLDYLKARLRGPKGSCHLVSKVTATETSMITLLSDPEHLRGFGLEVAIGDHKSKLLLDTGAGGILINRRLAEKSGLARISDTSIRGIGDNGAVGGYFAMAPSIKVGGLEFQNCPIEVMDRRTVADEDGLIGADVFADFLVDLDFAHQKLRLKELPRRPDQAHEDLVLNAEGDHDDPDASASEKSRSNATQKPADHGPFDRYVAPEMKEYSTVLRYGHLLLIPTFVEQEKQARFFLLDSGDFTTQLSLSTAKAATKVHNEEEARVKGLNGEVNKVYNADKATLTFAHLRLPTEGILVLNLKGLSDDVGTEVGGILGFTLLRFLDIKVDYRDGLVWMDYQGPKWLVH
jgi:Tfp pilus assembly protein PilF